MVTKSRMWLLAASLLGAIAGSVFPESEIVQAVIQVVIQFITE